MKIIISNIIQVTDPTDKIKEYCKKELTIKNPEYAKKQQMGFWCGGTNKYIYLYDYDEDNVYLPIGCFNDLYEMYPNKSLYSDYSVSKRVSIKSNINLRNYQKPCLEAIKKYVNGLFVLPCGLGKTECALQTAFYLQQKTLFITHTKDLMNQAKERCEEKMTCTTSIISDGKVDTTGDITFATVQTLFKNLDKISQDEFGLVVVDECFPEGTLISTPYGSKKIEDIKIGDEVYSYNHKKHKVEIKIVNYLYNKETNDLVTITLCNGRKITCTLNHPIYTDRGYIRADKLKKGDVVYEMQSMWERDCERGFYKRSMGKESILFPKSWTHLLFERMFPQICNKQLERLCTHRESNESYEVRQSCKKRRSSQESFKSIEGKRTQTNNTRRQWPRYYRTSKNFIKRNKENISTSNCRIGSTNEDEKRFWISDLLQIRYWFRRKENRNRNRWTITSFFRTKTPRYKKDRILRTVWVEDIEVQKRGCVDKFTNNNGRIKVYNIGIKDNHNYFVDGILVHNCHHLSANAESVGMFRECLDHFAARYKLGLTATLHRSDGLECCIPKLLGDVVYEIIQDNNDYVGMYEGKEIIRFPMNEFQVPVQINFINTDYKLLKNGNYRDVFEKDGMTLSFSRLLSDIGNDKDRNKLIIDLCNSLKGSTIILSDRVEQLKYLNEHIDGSVEIDGSTKKNIREQAIEDVKNGKHKVLLASYKLAKEGLDCKILENVIFATPIKDEAIVIQCIGRVQRTYPGKTIANVYDLVDDVSMLDKFLSRRRSIYKKKGWWKK